jgi:ketosteroid isomerase-like protein
MRSILLMVFIFNTCIVFSQKRDDVKTVIESMKIQETAWNNADIAGFMRYYWNSDSLKFIGSKGITYGWKKTYDNYVKGYPTKDAMGILKFTIKEATQLSETSIYIIGQWDLTKEKPAGGYFTLLWKKINNEWVIVADHTS